MTCPVACPVESSGDQRNSRWIGMESVSVARSVLRLPCAPFPVGRRMGHRLSGVGNRCSAGGSCPSALPISPPHPLFLFNMRRGLGAVEGGNR